VALYRRPLSHRPDDAFRELAGSHAGAEVAAAAHYGLPSGWRLITPGPEDSVCYPPALSTSVFLRQLEFGLRFPLHRFINLLLQWANVAIAQLHLFCHTDHSGLDGGLQSRGEVFPRTWLPPAEVINGDKYISRVGLLPAQPSSTYSQGLSSRALAQIGLDKHCVHLTNTPVAPLEPLAKRQADDQAESTSRLLSSAAALAGQMEGRPEVDLGRGEPLEKRGPGSNAESEPMDGVARTVVTQEAAQKEVNSSSLFGSLVSGLNPLDIPEDSLSSVSFTELGLSSFFVNQDGHLNQSGPLSSKRRKLNPPEEVAGALQGTSSSYRPVPISTSGDVLAVSAEGSRPGSVVASLLARSMEIVKIGESMTAVLQSLEGDAHHSLEHACELCRESKARYAEVVAKLSGAEENLADALRKLDIQDGKLSEVTATLGSVDNRAKLAETERDKLMEELESLRAIEAQLRESKAAARASEAAAKAAEAKLKESEAAAWASFTGLKEKLSDTNALRTEAYGQGYDDGDKDVKDTIKLMSPTFDFVTLARLEAERDARRVAAGKAEAAAGAMGSPK
ncbi:hypothetical protein RND81_02G183200, partial [Saponaria officinalis]